MSNSDIYRNYLADSSTMEFDDLPKPNPNSNEELYLYCLCKMLHDVIEGPDHYVENAVASAEAAKLSEEEVKRLAAEVEVNEDEVRRIAESMGVAVDLSIITQEELDEFCQ